MAPRYVHLYAHDTHCLGNIKLSVRVVHTLQGLFHCGSEHHSAPHVLRVNRIFCDCQNVLQSSGDTSEEEV